VSSVETVGYLTLAMPMNLGGRFILIGVRIGPIVCLVADYCIDLSKVDYVALLQTMPTQFALLFFNIRGLQDTPSMDVIAD